MLPLAFGPYVGWNPRNALMIPKTVIFGFAILFFCLFSIRPACADEPAPDQSAADKKEAIAKSLKWHTGTITLQNGLAKIILTDDFKYLDAIDARKVIHDLSGNPDDPSILGMIFPREKPAAGESEWAVTIHYDEGGYVKDDDAGKINYDDLLKNMKKQVLEANPEREKQGYPPAELVGWAAPPRYDQLSHKLYWAKELHFGNDPDNTLNYDIRILGRRGVLILTVIASESDFPQIDQKVPEILSMVDFQPGNTYADFDPKIDKVAEYGLAALIAGGALAGAAKLGLFGLLFKYIIVAVVALKKAIIFIIVAVVAAVQKLWAKFTGKSKTPDHLLPPGPK